MIRTFINNPNIIVGNDIILYVTGATATSASIAWGDGITQYTSISDGITHTYESAGTYNITILVDDLSVLCEQTITVKETYTLDASLNIRHIEEELSLPYSNIEVPSNHAINANIFNELVSKIYDNFSYLSSSTKVITPILPVYYNGWYGQKTDDTAKWYLPSESLSDNILNKSYVDCLKKDQYILLATSDEITIHNNNSTLSLHNTFRLYTENIPFSFLGIKCMEFDKKGRLFVADSENIYKFNTNISTNTYALLKTFPLTKIKNQKITNINRIYFDDDNLLYIVDSGNDKNVSKIAVYDTNLNFKHIIAENIDALSISVKNDKYYVLTSNNEIYIYNKNYTINTILDITDNIVTDDIVSELSIDESGQSLFVLSEQNMYKFIIENGSITFITNLTQFNTLQLEDNKFKSFIIDSELNMYVVCNNALLSMSVFNSYNEISKFSDYPWSINDLKLSPDSYLKNESFNVILKRLYDLNYLLLNSINSKIVRLIYPSKPYERIYINIPQSYSGELSYKNVLIYHNEVVCKAVFQRCFDYLLQIQEIILSIITMDIDTAILAKVKSLIQQDMYPVGEILVTRRDGNPSSWLGFGIWERFAKHRMLVGYDPDNAAFDELDAEGGSETHTLIVDEIPSHSHTGVALSAGDHEHNYNDFYNASSPRLKGSGDSNAAAYIAQNAGATSVSGEHEHDLSIDNTGGGQAFNIMNPHKVVYMWKRTA